MKIGKNHLALEDNARRNVYFSRIRKGQAKM